MATHKEHSTCHYHLCRKKAEVHLCKYCGNAYCEKHLKPTPPSLPGDWFKHSNYKDIFSIEDWRDPNRHPCPYYYDDLVSKAKHRDKTYWDYLEKLIGRRKKHPDKKVGRTTDCNFRYEPTTASLDREKDWYWSKKELKESIKILLLLAFFVVAALYVLQNGSELTTKLSDIKMGLFSNQYTPSKEIHIYDCKIYPDKCKNYIVPTNISVNAEQQNTTQPNITLTENKPNGLPASINNTPAPQKETYWKEGVGWVSPGSEYYNK